MDKKSPLDFFLPKSKGQEAEVDEAPELEISGDATNVAVDGDEKPREQQKPAEKKFEPDPDWIKELPGHQREIEIHEELAEEYEKGQEKDKE